MTTVITAAPDDFGSLALAFARAQDEVNTAASKANRTLDGTACALRGGGAADAYNQAHRRLAEGVFRTLGALVERLGEAALAAWTTEQNLRAADFDSNVRRSSVSPEGSSAPHVLATAEYTLLPAAPTAGAGPEQTPLEPLHVVADAWLALSQDLQGTASRLSSTVTGVCRPPNTGRTVERISEYFATLWPGHSSLVDRLVTVCSELATLLRGGISAISEFQPRLAVGAHDPDHQRLTAELDALLGRLAYAAESDERTEELRRAAAAVPVLFPRRAHTQPVPRVAEDRRLPPSTPRPGGSPATRWTASRVQPLPVAPPATPHRHLEVAVATLTCGTVVSAVAGLPGMEVGVPKLGRVGVDVVSGSGAYISVVGLGRGQRSAKVFREKLTTLRIAAQREGRLAQAYFERDGLADVPGNSVAVAAEVLGRRNVVLFTDPERGMTDGFFRWYRARLTERGAEAMLRCLAAEGLMLDQNPSEEARLRPERALELAALANPPDHEVAFQLWLDAETDVWMSCQLLDDDRMVVDFTLDGLGRRSDDVVYALVKAMHLGRLCDGFVLDYTGRSENVDWDAVVRGEPRRIATAPYHLGLAPGVALRHPELSQKHATPYGDLSVYSWPRR